MIQYLAHHIAVTEYCTYLPLATPTPPTQEAGEDEVKRPCRSGTTLPGTV